jgi:hypothetical protein
MYNEIGEFTFLLPIILVNFIFLLNLLEINLDINWTKSGEIVFNPITN